MLLNHVKVRKAMLGTQNNQDGQLLEWTGHGTQPAPGSSITRLRVYNKKVLESVISALEVQ